MTPEIIIIIIKKCAAFKSISVFWSRIVHVLIWRSVPPLPQTGHTAHSVPLHSREHDHLCDPATSRNQRLQTYADLLTCTVTEVLDQRPLGRPDSAVHSWFSPGRQGLRIIMIIIIIITEMNDDGTFCMECSKTKLADGPPSLPPLTLLLQFP